MVTRARLVKTVLNQPTLLNVEQFVPSRNPSRQSRFGMTV
jgi:hypothetical protein